MSKVKIENLKLVERYFGCLFKYANTITAEWTRIFIIRSDGATIGRMSLYNNELRNFKNYKRAFIDTLDETDQIMCCLCKYLKDGTITSLDIYNSIVIEAKQIQMRDLKKKIAWRNANPKDKCRRRLTGKNIRHIVSDLIMSL